MIIYITIQTSAGLTELLMFNDLQNILEVGFLCFKQSEVNRRVLYKIGAEKNKENKSYNKMGFKSATKTQHIVDNVVFPSKRDYELINQIDLQLLKLYSPNPDDELWPTKNESPARESIEQFNQILDNVQNITNNLDTVELGETDDSAFEGLFPL